MYENKECHIKQLRQWTQAQFKPYKPVSLKPCVQMCSDLRRVSTTCKMICIGKSKKWMDSCLWYKL